MKGNPMGKKKDDRLKGMKQITAYAGYSPPTIIRLCRQEGFPAKKIGGEWEASRSTIDSWWEEKIKMEDAV